MPDAINAKPIGLVAPMDRSPRSVGKVSQNAGTSALEKACQDFESIFINQMMQQMRQTVPQNGLFNGGQAEQIYTSMLDSEMANSIAEQRSLGLSQVLYRQLSALENKERSEGEKFERADRIPMEPENQLTE